MRVPIEIVEVGSGKPVKAELFDEVTMDHFLETQTEWRPMVLDIARCMAASGASIESVPQHWHWDWTRKGLDLGMLAIAFYGVGCAGRLQGIMKVETVSHRGRLPDQRGKPLVYIDYLETAPWNIKSLMHVLNREPVYGAIGTRLVEAAVRMSMEEGFKGRVGLHSLRYSERFYLSTCGMTPVGRDPDNQGLLWYEFTPEGAERFLRGEDQ